MTIHEAKEYLLSKKIVRYTNPTNKNQTEQNFGLTPLLPNHGGKGIDALNNELEINQELRDLYNTYPNLKVFIYCMKYNLTPDDIPRCPVCNEYCKLNDVGSKYFRRTCSKMECQNIVKRNQSLANFGTINISQSDVIKNKKSASCIEHYGVEWSVQSKEIKDKIKNTNIKKRGKDYKKETAAKGQLTVKKRYGVDNISQAEGIQSKKSFRYWYQGLKFDSSYELCYYIYNIENNINIKRCSDRFSYEDSNNKTHYYHPDFKIDNQYFEIKGEHLLDENGNLTSEVYDKNKSVKDLNFHKQNLMKSLGVHLVTQEEIKRCFAFIENKFGKKYISSFKKSKKVIRNPTNKDIILQKFLESRKINYEINIKIKNNFYPFVIYENYKPIILIGEIPLEGYKHISYNSLIENIIRDILNYFNLSYDEEIKFILRKCSDFPEFNNDIDKEFEKLKPYLIEDISTGIGIIRHFHKSLFSYNQVSKISPEENWKDKEKVSSRIKEKFIEKSEVTSEEVLLSFEEAPIINVLFPVFCKNEANVYLNDCKTIIDPYIDLSGKLLGVTTLNKKYIGLSNNDKLVQESKDLISYFNLDAEVFLNNKESFESDGLFTFIEESEVWKKINNEYRNTDDIIDECLKLYKCNRYLFLVSNTEKYKEFITGVIENTSQFNDNKRKYIVLIDKKMPWHILAREKKYKE